MANATDLGKALGGYFNRDDVVAMTPEERQLTINSAGIESVGVGSTAEDKPVVGFAEVRKKVVVNASRKEQLAALFGDDDLLGKKVVLGVDRIKGHDQITFSAPE